MHFEFPFGKAAFSILVLCVISAVAMVYLDRPAKTAERKPDLVFAFFARQHVESYRPVFEQFERDTGLRVSWQLVEYRAITQRMQAAMQVGAEIPDMVEIPDIAPFVRGPLEDVGFVDLTKKVHESGLYSRLVESRFTKWSSRGHIFALPHDVHPMLLAYRRDIVEQLGIDVNKIETWDDFVKVGREVTKDLDGDGVVDRYMIDLQDSGSDYLRGLLLQANVGLFDQQGNVAFDTPEAAKVCCWYVRQCFGKDRIAFAAGWGQTFSKTMLDGLVLFYPTPDWRTFNYQDEVPGVSGRLAFMPMPAWEKGGRRVATWGGTGLGITKKCRNFDAAWKLAMRLYYDREQLGERFRKNNIITPLKDAWNLPEYNEPRPFYSNQPLGRIFAKYAPDVPAEYVTPFTPTAQGKLSEAFANIRFYYETHGDDGLEEYAKGELKRCADRVREIIARNAFYAEEAGK